MCHAWIVFAVKHVWQFPNKTCVPYLNFKKMLQLLLWAVFLKNLYIAKALNESTNSLQVQSQLLLNQTVFEDVWGFETNWTNLKDGWTEEKRKFRVTEHFNTIQQSSSMQAFTKLGYMKTKIPALIHQKILQHKKQKRVSTEACSSLKGFTNCESVDSNGILGNTKYTHYHGTSFFKTNLQCFI